MDVYHCILRYFVDSARLERMSAVASAQGVHQSNRQECRNEFSEFNTVWPTQAGAVHTTYQAKSGTGRSVVSRTTPKTRCSRSGQVRSLLSKFVMRYNMAGNIAMF